MGLLDNLGGSLGGMLGQVTAAAAPGLISAMLAKTNFGDMQGIVNQLQQGGLGDQVKSWLGNGSNLPVTPNSGRPRSEMSTLNRSRNISAFRWIKRSNCSQSICRRRSIKPVQTERCNRNREL